MYEPSMFGDLPPLKQDRHFSMARQHLFAAARYLTVGKADNYADSVLSLIDGLSPYCEEEQRVSTFHKK